MAPQVNHPEIAVAVKIIDLQLLYGVAGAREKFEDLCSLLVKAEQPAADKVRVSRGDGGIDVHVGDLTSPDGIEVYQCKFFPQGLDDSQKGQIRDSFKTCRTNFMVRRWTLCLPLDLSKPEKTWFEKWRSDQAEHGVAISDVWGATKLESLLYQSKNQSLREVFFKEEHLTQLRELHTKLLEWIPDILERLKRDPGAEARDAEAQVRSDAYLAQMIHIQLTRYLRLNTPAPLKLSALQEAKKRSDLRYAAELEEAARRPDHWQVTISPTRIPDRAKFATLSECWSIVEDAQERRVGRRYPVVEPDRRETGGDWTGSADVYGPESECWAMSQRGLFTHHFTLYDDVAPMPPSERLMRHQPAGFLKPRFVDIDLLAGVVTDVYRFAARLADKLVDSGDDSLRVSIRLTGTQNRVLTARDDPGRMRDWYACTLDALEHAWTHRRGELQANPDALAVKALVWFVERFGQPDVREDNLTKVQDHMLSKR